MDATEVDATGKEAAGVEAAEIGAAWQRVVNVQDMEGSSRHAQFRAFKVGVQVVLLKAQKVEEQKKERVWVAGVGWSKGVMCSRLEQMVQFIRRLEAQQKWLEAADRQQRRRWCNRRSMRRGQQSLEGNNRRDKRRRDNKESSRRVLEQRRQQQ